LSDPLFRNDGLAGLRCYRFTPFKTNKTIKTMKQTIILLIAIIASSITLGVSCTAVNDNNAADRNIYIIDSLKREIIIRDSTINMAINLMDNNQLWDKDGSDEMSDFITNLSRLYNR